LGAPGSVPGRLDGAPPLSRMEPAAVASTLTPALLEVLRCPRCKGPLAPPEPELLRCATEGCARTYPIVAGRPVLIDDDRSVFAQGDYKPGPGGPAPAAGGALGRLREWARRVPSPSVNLSAVRCFERMRAELLARTASPLVLIV